MRLYHTGRQEIRRPDVCYGRKNADFGQGFYMTAQEDFACRWARQRKGEDTVLNTYDLDLSGLAVRRLARDESWFDYIFANRASKPDAFPEADVILGPIANDTIYDTYGIITSGFLSRETALQLLLIGPDYEQIVLKTEKAAGQLQWLSARVLAPEEISSWRETVSREEQAFQELFAARLQQLL